MSQVLKEASDSEESNLQLNRQERATKMCVEKNERLGIVIF